MFKLISPLLLDRVPAMASLAFVAKTGRGNLTVMDIGSAVI